MRAVKMSVRRRNLATAVAALALAGALPAQARAAETGVNPVFQDPAGSADTVGQLGAKWVRAFVRWDQVEPDGPGVWMPGSLRELEGWTAIARLRGLRVVATVVGAPRWANGSGDPYVPPRDPGDYARFLNALAARERGRVAAWEIWNEPDEKDFWHGPVGPEHYAPLLKAAGRAVREADPSALVLAAPSTGNNYRFLEGLYAAGAGEAFGGVAVHTDTACLTTRPDSYYREADGRVGRFSFLGFREVHDVLALHGHAERPVIMTELGWSATRMRCERGASAGRKAAGVGEAEQASNLRLAYHCLSFYPYVRAALWFSLRDTAAADGEMTRYGLQRHDGSRRPAFDALAAIGKGTPAGSGECGDFAPPSLTVLAPAPGALYDRSLAIEVSARDAKSKLGRISFNANGRRIRSFTGGDLANGRRIGIEWMGARDLPYGPVTVTIEALDEFGNTVRREIVVQRVDPAALPARRPRIALRLSGRGVNRRVRGKVSSKGFAFKPGGKVVVQWQYRRKGRWVTLHKRSANANRPFDQRQRLRKPGRWRVLAQYSGEKPFLPARSSRSFRAR